MRGQEGREATHGAKDVPARGPMLDDYDWLVLQVPGPEILVGTGDFQEQKDCTRE